MVFRVEKNRNFTVMSNHHLRDKNLSLKAKGLLSLMLSLPEDWDYTMKGLAKLCTDGIDSVRSTLIELGSAGYVTRHQTSDDKGRFACAEYDVREIPVIQEAKQPLLGFPITDNPITEKPISENPTQLNTNVQSTKGINIGDIEQEPETKSGKGNDAEERTYFNDDAVAEFGGDVKEALAEWLEYKHERHEDYRQRGLKALVTTLKKNVAQFGESAVCDCIRESMANNYHGITYDLLSKRGKNQRGNVGAYNRQKPFTYDYSDTEGSI